MSAILVTGATGNVGTHLVHELRRRGEPTRAFVRDVGKARAMLDDDVELAVGDLGDPASVAAALDGVDRVFLLTPSHPEMVTWERTVLQAAAAAGVRLVVKMSTIGADPGSNGRFGSWQGRCEELLRASGIPSVLLQSAFHMTNVLFAVPSIREAGRIFAPLDKARIAMIDRRDLAAAAAETLTGEGHAGRTYTLTGPESITYSQVATVLTRVLGRPVAFVDVPDEAAIDAMLQAGAPDWLARGIVEVHRQVRGGMAALTTDVVRVLTGRDPYDFDAFARDVAHVFL
jgi:uncharacterized protein YbjT (DUF2867 family)